MTNSLNFPAKHYPADWLQSVHSKTHPLFIPLQDNAGLEAESLRTLFAPSAGTLYVYRPSKRQITLTEYFIFTFIENYNTITLRESYITHEMRIKRLPVFPSLPQSLSNRISR